LSFIEGCSEADCRSRWVGAGAIDRREAKGPASLCGQIEQGWVLVASESPFIESGKLPIKGVPGDRLSSARHDAHGELSNVHRSKTN